MTALPPDSVDATLALLDDGGYVADRRLATAVFLALRLGRPLLLEGEAGVGKTAIAATLADRLGRRLIRLQCYEGLDLASAVYDWNYSRQMLAIRLAEAKGAVEQAGAELWSDAFLIRRPILEALSPQPDGPPVLLIDELDRADEPFEAFLLEVLADYAVTVPELGRITAPAPPIVIITSNRTREVHDALRRRCLYHWVDYPDAERELLILKSRLPDLADRLSRQVVAFVARLRDRDLYKAPGIAETIDWAQALAQLDVIQLDPTVIESTLGALLKYQDDITRVSGDATASLLEEIRAAMTADTVLGQRLGRAGDG